MITFNDDPWDDFEEKKEEKRSLGALTTPRILVGLAVLAVVAVVVARMISLDPPDLTEMPPQLIGLWSCDDPARSDHYVEFRREFVTFGTGGTGTVKFRVSGIDVEKVGTVDGFTVRYRDLAGIKHRTSMLLDETGTVLRFNDEPSVRWSRVDL
jgi:hypothetical protein